MEQKLVDYLVSQDIVARKEIQRSVLRASMNKSSVVDEIIEETDVQPANLAKWMAKYWGLEVWQKATFDVEPAVLEILAGKLARSYGVLPIERNRMDGLFKLAVYDVERARPVIEEIRKKTGVSPSLVVAPRDVLIRELRRYYGTSEGAGDQPTEAIDEDGAPSPQGVVLKKKGRRERPERKTAAPRPAGSPTDDPNATKAPFDDAAPTRQVDVADDNPFLDLIQQTAKGGSSDASTDEVGPPTRDMVVEDDGEFFDGFEDISVEDSTAESDPAKGALRDQQQAATVEGLDQALDQFDAELGDSSEATDDDVGPVASTSSVSWGQFAETEKIDRGRGSRPDGRGAGSQAGGTTEESGLFPVERDGFFEFEDEGSGELTLAKVVERQRRIIDKLEREIEYQKGIVQTIAELLVEARVLSKRALKSRLKAFKEEQRKQYGGE